ncbi:hypothetical protein CL648_04720 [bacterium]|nr:hypothetical protein [bacterium]|tara:strand:- start:545 stop:2341 length:1797 start_codon:yes stop_codon:yes gene_type:complete
MTILWIFAGLYSAASLTYALSLWSKNPSIIDVYWALGIVGIASTWSYLNPIAAPGWLVLAMLWIWGLRLSGFLWWTRIRHNHVDHRYTTMREQWKGSDWIKQFKLWLHYLFQASIQSLLILGLLPVLQASHLHTRWTSLGISLIGISLVGQYYADRQLSIFKQTRKPNTICSTGLWAYSRHPNYCFEWLMWVGFAVLSQPYSGGLWAWVMPISMWVVFRYLSGPYTERCSCERHGDVYRRYQNETPMIIPDVYRWVVCTIQLPDWLYRLGIRYQLSSRLRALKKRYKTTTIHQYADALKTGNIAYKTDAANDQHYEVPTEFYTYALGKHKKYSSGFYSSSTVSLDQAEAAMLEKVCQRARLSNDQTILELGCGWGSFCLYAAQKYPKSKFLAISNSETQEAYINQQISERGLKNLMVKRANVAEIRFRRKFDRIVSIELFEHLHNYDRLFKRLAAWLADDGYAFIHIFGHRQYAYPFEVNPNQSWVANWMSRYFFSGGQMPSRDLFQQAQSHLSIHQQWDVSGTHYAQTCRDWLNNMDAHRPEILAFFHANYGKKAKQYWIFWRLFFMACEELFKTKRGSEWQVFHYLFEKPKTKRSE